MNEIAPKGMRCGPREDEDDGVNAALKIILTTQTSRYIHITAWALLLSAVANFSVVLIWYALTMGAGFIRSFIEKKMRASEAAQTDKSHRRYAFAAMSSCAFWAAAPVLACLSGHPYSVPAAVFFIVNGYMLAFSQFRSTPANALIVTSPYAVAYAICLFIVAGTDLFWPMFAGAPLLTASISYVLMFGHMSQQELNRANRERDALIEELETARIAAEKASEAKSMFLANMSHEIRTPMNGVLGMAELLANTRLDNRQKIFADTIHKSGAALLTIINDILDFSKIEAGKLELESAPFDLRSSIEDVAALVAARAQEKNIEMIVRFQPDLPSMLIGDGGRLRQVITNLVGNAVKFTKEGYVLVNVSGEVKDGFEDFRIEVTDTGVGIDSAKAGKIFDPFQQADTSTTRNFGGTGLGLSISKRLMEAMGGAIGVTSSLGEGSTFWVEARLPIQIGKELSPQTTFEAGGRRALIVDDIHVNRQIMTELLQSWGFRVQAAASAQEALAMMHAGVQEDDPYAIVILDYFMPEIDGEELARRIKEDERLGATPLMVLTSVDRAGDARRFKEIGVEGYLVKPARSAVVFETIAAILQSETESISAPETTNTIEPFHRTAQIEVVDKIRLLLAEDNEVNQLVIKHMLDLNKIDLVVANNGREALNYFEDDETRFDLILMDVSMPEMDGYETTRAIRQIEHGAKRSRTPIVCLTAHVMASDIERSSKAGMDDYLSKPVSKEDLDRIIARWARQAERGSMRARL